MKLSHLLWVLGLAGIVAGCNSGDPVSGCAYGINLNGDCCPRTAPLDPETGKCGTTGTGGTGGGTGGTGGGTGACTNSTDEAVYAELTYVNGGGETSTGTNAPSAIASDCVFGSQVSDPKNPGCGQQAQAVLICAAQGCPQETIDNLTNCVVDCMQGLIDEISGGSTLSQECADCYGASVSCSAVNCATAGCTNPNSQSCIQCRCDFDCTPGFDRCSGLPPSGDCN